MERESLQPEFDLTIRHRQNGGAVRSGRNFYTLGLAEVYPLGYFECCFAIDFGLFFSESIAFACTALGSIDAALTAPAQPLAGEEAMHLITRMMYPTTVAKKHFRHGGLASE